MDQYVYEFISKQTGDPIVEWRTCKASWEKFAIFQSDLDFLEKMSPTFGGKKFQIPLPTLCPEERQRKRLCLRNERKLYRRKCDFSGKSIISAFSPDKSYKVYDQDIWLSDKWSWLDYWVALSNWQAGFDFNKPFSQQFKEMHDKVPVQALISTYNENCSYTSICGYCKNCYLITASENSEDCFYGHLIQDCRDVIDCCFAFNSERSYGCVDIKKCFNCYYLISSYGCNDCYYSVNLENCNSCFLSNNLSNKSYIFENKQLTKEEYQKKVEEFTKENRLSRVHLYPVMQKAFYKNLVWYRNEKVFGNLINDSSDVIMSVDVDKWEHIKYCQIAVDGDNLMDCCNVYINNHLSYEVMSGLSTNCNIFSGFIFNCDHTILSYNCNTCSFLFGCSGLRNQKYCIFNKQYSPSEYEQLVAKIIAHLQSTGERWEFFDQQTSSFGYNETVAQDFMPLTKEEALKKWFKRSDYEDPFPHSDKILKVDELPQDIHDVSDDILNQVILCEVSGKPFRIIAQELEFYRKHNLPLPRRHPDQRYFDRMQLRPWRNLYLRNCDKCGKEMLSAYPKENEFKIYCEECYNREIYW